jgi:hypothetical protein
MAIACRRLGRAGEDAGDVPLPDLRAGDARRLSSQHLGDRKWKISIIPL